VVEGVQLTAFLVIAGITVPVSEGNAIKRIERVGTSSRAFAGGLRSTVRAEKRVWQVVTGLLIEADAVTLEAAIANAAQVTCSGNALGGSITCEVEQGDAAYISTATVDGLGYMRTLSLVLREV
jgi:hypothetical protein